MKNQINSSIRHLWTDRVSIVFILILLLLLLLNLQTCCDCFWLEKGQQSNPETIRIFSPSNSDNNMGDNDSILNSTISTGVMMIGDGNVRYLDYNIDDQIPDEDDDDRTMKNIILIVVYSLLMIVSLIGNILVCRVLLLGVKNSFGCNPSMNIATGTGTSKLLIINLAISDLLLTTVNIPINLVRFVTYDWPFGEFVCIWTPYVQSVSAYCSSWTMLVIAFERYRRIIRHKAFHHRIQKELNQQQLQDSSLPSVYRHQPSSHCKPYGGNRDTDGDEPARCHTPRPTQVNSHSLQPHAFHQHHHYHQDHTELLQKLSPFSRICVQFGQMLVNAHSAICRCFCSLFCCCCPERWTACPSVEISAEPVVDHQSGTTSTTKTTTATVTASSKCALFSMCHPRLPAGFILPTVWLISTLLSIPHSFYSRIKQYDFHTIHMTRCITEPHPWLGLYTVGTQYLLPIGLTTFFYLHIGVFLWRRGTVGTVTEGRRLYLLQCKRRRVRMLILVVVIFAVCWAPLHLHGFLVDFQLIRFDFPIFFTVYWFAMSSVCYNPFIYCWMNEAFRQKTKNILKCFVPYRLLAALHLGLCFCCYCLCCCRWPFRRLNSEFVDSGDTPLTNGGNGDTKNVVTGGATATTMITTTDTILDRIPPSVTARIKAFQLNSLDGTINGSGTIANKKRNNKKKKHRQNGRLNEYDESRSWSSSTMSATGQQQAISELISMSALLEQDLLQNQANQTSGTGDGGCSSSGQQPQKSNQQPSSSTLAAAQQILKFTKEQRLALMTTQSGRRRHHHNRQLVEMLKMNQDLATRTTSINLISTSPELSMESASGGEMTDLGVTNRHNHHPLHHSPRSSSGTPKKNITEICNASTRNTASISSVV